MVHYGDPAWYHKHVKHLVPAFTGQTVEGSVCYFYLLSIFIDLIFEQKMPKNPEELKEMILEIKEKKRQARLEREAWPESERWSSQLPILPEKLKEDPPQRLV